MPGPGPDTKGGGQYGGPQRWTGKGPRPARHIPWPELFKHHESVLKGHLRMMDMVRKHCVEGSGNWKMAQACVDRTHEMVRDFKKATYNFVPPPDNIERVPLGASSASMYPGYSPADHIYGEAAQEYGQRIAAARKKGLEIKQDADGLDYVVGQSSLSAKEQIEEIRRAREEAQKQKATATPLQSENAGKDGQDEEDQATLFTIDSNPTPLSQLNTKLNSKSKDKARDKAKRHHTASFSDEPNTSLSNTEPQTKKVKVSASEPLGNDANANEEFEKAVADRKARKEEKRKRKEEKKRKRESNSSQMAPPPEDGSREVDVPAQSPMPERPKKKKHKKDHEPAIETNASEPGVKQQKTDRDAISDTSGLQPKEKHKKEKKRTKDEADEVPVGGNADKKKKKHKDHAG